MAIGLATFATYIPAGVQSSEYLARETGIPREVIETRFGLKSKPWASDGEQVSTMAVKAACCALAGADPKSIDVVLWNGSEHKDFALWTAAIKLQHEIGATNAWAVDIGARCATTQACLKFARDMIASDPAIRRVLVGGGHRMIDKLNYRNERSRFLFTMSDAASAFVVERDAPANEILGTAILTDGSFSEDVVVPGGGTRLPLTRDNFDPALLCLDVRDPAAMKERLDRVSLGNFLSVIERAVERSGARLRDIGYLAIIHMKPSAYARILRELGLTPEQSTYLDEFGHAGAPDVIRSLELGRREGKLKDGDLVVLAGAGTGYIWAATCLRWGPICK